MACPYKTPIGSGMMATRKKPKKALIQFLVAAVFSVIALVVAGFLFITIITAISTNAENEKAQLSSEYEKTQEELEKLKKLNDAKKYVPVVRATEEIPAGTFLNEEMLEVVDIEADKPQIGTFQSLDEVSGKIALAQILSGETLTERKLMDTSQGVFTIQEGMRAITISVDSVAALNGLIVPGLRVDVLATLNTKDEQFSRTLIQNALVIDVDNGNSVNRRTTNQSVTLAVTPDQAEKLALANRYGQFHLALRSFDDKNITDVSGTEISRLINNGPPMEFPVNLAPIDALPEPAILPPAPQFTMEIFKGANSETATFELEQ